ncbi:AbrB/MazE/SpoVT family DNA-binding domain-containing protein [Vagococcus hydrophili]|uniref:AbrB/MazE/SpoVT family DNA-binding domain-containing protein n=1 Tax=Vagococcus hydrophili TaxID=2714947 RepID=A0A6G8AWA1_9ENTE|nr:DUF998 domain-containing protein [Vagococcus hydrophili]QIL49225.1 AbrB/MazE/SpoVT family DNA-binding domain-containing protein [Vagococcus hydrophili]
MKLSEFKVKLPEEIVEELKLSEQDTIFLKKENNRVIIERKKNVAEFQEVSLRWFLIPVILSSLAFFIFFYFENSTQIPMAGEVSIASAVSLLGLISGSISFIFFFIKEKKNQENDGLKDILWRNVPTVIFSFMVMLSLGILCFFWMIGIMFDGASFDIYTATVVFFLFTAIINYLMIYAALSFTSNMIVNLLIFVIIGGVFFAMLTNSESKWWQHNFSFLGTNEAVNSWQFNLTLMLSALLLVALIDYLFVNLKKRNYVGWKIQILRVLLTLMAIALGAVGFFPNNGTGQLHVLHTKAANWLVLLIIILIIGIKWLLPKVTKEFLIISYGIAGTLIIANFLFQNIGYLSLTVFELIAFGLAFSWILLLLQHIQKLTHFSSTIYEIEIEES